MGCPASTPIASRTPVPLLPKSSRSPGSFKPPTPRPQTCQRPVAGSFSTSAPSDRMAAAVLRTSSPSSKPSMRDSPTDSAASIKAR